MGSGGAKGINLLARLKCSVGRLILKKSWGGLELSNNITENRKGENFWNIHKKGDGWIWDNAVIEMMRAYLSKNVSFQTCSRVLTSHIAKKRTFQSYGFIFISYTHLLHNYLSNSFWILHFLVNLFLVSVCFLCFFVFFNEKVKRK